MVQEKITPQGDTEKRLQTAFLAAEEKKADNAAVLDLRGLASFTDFFLISHGQSERQVQAIADNVIGKLRDEKLRPLSVEGYRRAEWILIDYADFVVHVFSESRREFYGLERLWSDAPVISRSFEGKTREEAS